MYIYICLFIYIHIFIYIYLCMYVCVCARIYSFDRFHCLCIRLLAYSLTIYTSHAHYTARFATAIAHVYMHDQS